MTINDLLDTAIRHEVSSQQLYTHLRDVVQDAETKAFLGDLIREETTHEALLLTVKDMEIYDGGIALEDQVVAAEVLASHGTAADITPESTIEDVLLLALSREHRAQQLFLRLAGADVHAELKELFEKLAEEEMNHHHAIEKKFAIHTGQMGFEM
jgi:rubrerythrin